MTHELGHFLTARKFGVKILEFGLGIPPRAWGKKVGDMILSLNWLPIGGFVRLMGEDETDKKTLNDPGSFSSKPVWQKMIIVAGGVTVNMITAWILFYIVLLGTNFKILYPTFGPVVAISLVEQGMPAAEAGLKVGDQFTSVNGKPVSTIEQAIQEIKSNPNKPVAIDVTDIDGKNKRSVTLTPKIDSEGVSRIGVAFSPVPFKEYTTPTTKIFSGILYSWDLTRYTFLGLGRLFSDVKVGNFEKASESFTGPIGLTVLSNNILSSGFEAILPYLWFMGIISLTLAIMNSLPFPALDGGRFVFLTYELIFRRKANPKFEALVNKAGMVALLALMVWVTMSDVNRFILNKFTF